MTVIVAMEDTNGRVVLGADTRTTFGWEPSTGSQPKIFKRIAGDRKLYIGVTGKQRFADVIRYAAMPEDGGVDMYSHQWVTTVLVPALREASKNAGWTERDKEREDHSCGILVVTGGRIFHIAGDWSVHEPMAPYWAIGCGGDHAAGALAALRLVNAEMDARQMATMAMEIACRHSAGCGAPFDILECEE